MDETTLMLDSTTIKVHQYGSGAKKGAATKIYMVTDDLGNPLHFLLSAGNRNDICMAQPLLEYFDLSEKLILADKGYDSNKFVKWVERDHCHTQPEHFQTPKTDGLAYL